MSSEDEREGAAAYARGECWRSTKPEGWRRGWIRAQNEQGVERARQRRGLDVRTLLKPEQR